MAQYIDKSALVAEIERLKKAEGWCQVGKDTADVYYARGFRFACERIKDALNTLEVKEVQEEPISEDLEKAAIEAFKQIVDTDKNNFLEIFKAGAKWQKEQMMKDAIECKVDWYDGFLLDYTQEQQDYVLEKIGEKVSDKVKVIIIKSE